MFTSDAGSSTALFTHLRRVCRLDFEACSNRPTGWNGTGNGEVAVSCEEPTVLTFTETGIWRPVVGKETRFTNVFRWTILNETNIRLEHLRFGTAHPVFLFDLAPTGGDEWNSISPHECREDCYHVRLRVVEPLLHVQWWISGPNKDEKIDYHYHYLAEPLSNGPRARLSDSACSDIMDACP